MGHALKLRYLKLKYKELVNQLRWTRHVSYVTKMACLQNITPYFAPWKCRFLKMNNLMNNFNTHSIYPVLRLLVLSQIPARNWLGFWKEGIKDYDRS